MILDADIASDRVVWSPRTLTVFGFTPEEMGGTLTEWVLTKIHPDDRRHLRDAWRTTLKEGGAQAPAELEHINEGDAVSEPGAQLR